MSDPYVREVGRIVEDGEVLAIIGVDYDSVSVRALSTFSAAQQEEFAQLFVSAVWQAGQQKAAMDADAATDARHEAIDRAEAFRDEMHDGTGASHD